MRHANRACRIVLVKTKVYLNEHLVLRNSHAILWVAPLVAKEDLDSG